MTNKFYVYEHWRPDKDVCFYVGKGGRKRAYFIHRKESVHHQRVVHKLARLGLCVEVRLVCGTLDEKEAFALEIERIAFWRAAGVNLVNKTNGGEGASGNVPSAQMREKISKFWKGRPNLKLRGRKHSIETRQKISSSNKGRKVSEETRIKISVAQKGKPRPELIGRKLSPEGMERLRNRVFTEEHRERISSAKKGIPKSEEHKRKLALASTGKVQSEETKKKMSLAKVGFRHSDATKEKIGASNRGRQSTLKGTRLSLEQRQKLVDAWVIRKQCKQEVSS